MERKRYAREFKLEAVRLVKERGVSVAQASRDLGVHANVLCEWVSVLQPGFETSGWAYSGSQL